MYVGEYKVKGLLGEGGRLFLAHFWLFITHAAKLGVLAEFLLTPAAAFNSSWGHFTTL
jgi:hypothetical protein